MISRVASLLRYPMTKPLCAAARISYKSIAEVKSMPDFHWQMSNEMIITLAMLGDQEARRERLVREIMSEDEIEYPAAEAVMHEMASYNQRCLLFPTLPYRLGILVAVRSRSKSAIRLSPAMQTSAAFLSIPMIFEINTVVWFNEAFVTSDVPEPKDLETPLEVTCELHPARSLDG